MQNASQAILHNRKSYDPHLEIRQTSWAQVGDTGTQGDTSDLVGPGW